MIGGAYASHKAKFTLTLAQTPAMWAGNFNMRRKSLKLRIGEATVSLQNKSFTATPDTDM
jgi:hypothetical protein